MLITLAISTGVSAVFTLGGLVITRADGCAGQTTVIQIAVATGLGVLAQIGGLTRLDAQGPAISRAEARPDYGMSWRQPAQVSVDR